MEKVYKAVTRALGGTPNGTGHTSCIDDAKLVQQIFILIGLAFTAGAWTVGFRGLPEKIKAVEISVSETKASVAETKIQFSSIDARLSRIENAILGARYESYQNNNSSQSHGR